MPRPFFSRFSTKILKIKKYHSNESAEETIFMELAWVNGGIDGIPR
jgi:hypothetical protein